MMSGSTTYDSITKRTTKEEEEEGVASPAAVRSAAARLVKILVGAAVLVALVTTTTKNLRRGLGGSMVSVRSRGDDPGPPRQPMPQMSPGDGPPIQPMPILGPQQIPEETPPTVQVAGSTSQCHFCAYYHCATGVPCADSDANKCTKCNYHNCNLFTNCT